MRVMKTYQFKSSVFYRVACDCGLPDCDMSLEIENSNSEIIYLHFYATYSTGLDYMGVNVIKRQWLKLKDTAKLLFLGEIKVDKEFVLVDKEHIDAFTEAIQDGQKYLENK